MGRSEQVGHGRKSGDWESMCWHCIVRGRLMQAKTEKKTYLDERQLFPLNRVPQNDGEPGPGSRCFLTASNVSQFEKNSSRRVGGVYHCASSVVQAHETRSGMPGLQYCCFSNGILCDSRPTIRHEDRLKKFWVFGFEAMRCNG